MPDEPTPPPPTLDQLNRLLRQHLASLEAAGVEWLLASRVPLPLFIVPDASTAPVEEAPDGPEARGRELTVLAERVSGCARCAELASARTQTVFGVGRLDPEVCFVGEAPGRDEDAQGEPFVGAAGQMLTRIIAAMGFRREDVYICNIIKCRPPGNRKPEAAEAHNCREYLERQLELVRPRHICALGATPITYLLGTSRSIRSMRGTVHHYKGIPVVCTYHPAYLLLGHRSTDEQEIRERKKMVWEDMKLLLSLMGRSVEKKPSDETSLPSPPSSGEGG